MLCLIQKFVVGILGVVLLSTLSACGGGSGGPGGGVGGNGDGGTSTLPIALYVYGNVYGPPNAPGYTEINPINTNGVVQPSVSQGPQTGVGPGQETLVTISGNRYLYISNNNGGANDIISIFSANGTILAAIGQVAAPGNLAFSAMVYTNGVLFVPLYSGNICSYAVNSNGSLTLLQSDAYSVSGGQPMAMALNSTGKYLVVSEYASTTTWNALSLTIRVGGSLILASQQSGISGDADNIQADPSTTNGDYLYGSASGYLYEIALSSGGAITVTANTAIPSNYNTEPYPGWIDPTGTWLFLAEFNYNTFAESLVQYKINMDGSLTTGSMPQIQIGTGSNGSVGGVTSSPGFYESTNGIVVIPVGGYLTTYTYNSLNGFLSVLSLRTGNASENSGIMAAYAP